MPPRRGRRGRKRTGPKKYKRRGRTGFRSKRKNPRSRVSKIVKEMKDMTEPITSIYNWANAYLQTALTSSRGLVVPLIEWYDDYDIATAHNQLQATLGLQTYNVINKFAVGNYECKFTIQNTSNMNCTMDIYTCAWREDVDQTIAPNTQFGSGTGNVQYANFLNPLFQGLSETGLNGINNGNWPIGLTPFDCPKFCTYVKILKVKKDVRLIGAGTKTYMIKDKKWNLWDGTKVGTCNGATINPDTAFRRKTKFVFAIVTGGPINDTTNKGAVCFAPITLNVTGIEKMSYTGMRNSSKMVYYRADVGNVQSISTIDLQTETVHGYVVA